MIPWTGKGENSKSAFAGKGNKGPAPGGKGKGKSKKPAFGGNAGAEKPLDNTVVMRAIANTKIHYRRKARVCGLADLFWEFGSKWTAKEIIEYYETLRIFAHKQEHGKSAPERRMAAQQRWRESGRYGFPRWQ